MYDATAQMTHEFEGAIQSLVDAGWLVQEEDACGEGAVLYRGGAV